MQDDDLFEDNEVKILSEEYNEDPVFDENTEDFVGLSDHDKQWLKSLKDQLGKTEDFSFAIYTSASINLFGIMSESYSGLKNPRAAYDSAMSEYLSGPISMPFEAILALKEQERFILMAGRYLRIIENVLRELSDSAKSKEPNSFAEYMFLNVGYHHKFLLLYLTELIEDYQSFCKDNHLEEDDLLVSEQCKRYLPIQDRMSYGNILHSPVVEGVGEVNNWQELRDLSQTVVSKVVIQLIGFLDDIIAKIRSGDPSVRELVHSG